MIPNRHSESGIMREFLCRTTSEVELSEWCQCPSFVPSVCDRKFRRWTYTKYIEDECKVVGFDQCIGTEYSFSFILEWCTVFLNVIL